MNKTNIYDAIVREKVLKKCIDSGYETYSKISLLLNTSDSFARAVFSAKRRKLNLYHLTRLSYELKCNLYDLLPNEDDYKHLYGSNITEYEGYLKSIGDVSND